jgi:hypothetical protein
MGDSILGTAPPSLLLLMFCLLSRVVLTTFFLCYLREKKFRKKRKVTKLLTLRKHPASELKIIILRQSDYFTLPTFTFAFSNNIPFFKHEQIPRKNDGKI